MKREFIEVVYDVNILRVRTTRDDITFGSLTDVDGTSYDSREI